MPTFANNTKLPFLPYIFRNAGDNVTVYDVGTTASGNSSTGAGIVTVTGTAYYPSIRINLSKFIFIIFVCFVYLDLNIINN